MKLFFKFLVYFALPGAFFYLFFVYLNLISLDKDFFSFLGISYNFFADSSYYFLGLGYLLSIFLFLISNSFLSFIINIFFIPIYIVVAYFSYKYFGYVDLLDIRAILLFFSVYIANLVFLSTLFLKKSFAPKLKEKIGEDSLSNEEITIVFFDIKNFTNISEKLKQPKLIGFFLNKIFEYLEKYIKKYNGVLDKINGDGALLVFRGSGKEKNAVKCFLEILNNIENLKKFILSKTTKEDYNNFSKIFKEEEFDIRVGISTGVVLMGNIGGKKINDVSILGDQVNFASRIEGINKVYNTKILCDYKTYENINKYFLVRLIDKIKVKGKKEGLFIFQPLGENVDNMIFDLDKPYIDNWNQAVKLYMKKNFRGAYDTLEERSTSGYESDPTFLIFRLRLHNVLNGKIQIPEYWDGAWKFDDK